MEEVYNKLVAAKGKKWTDELLTKLDKALTKNPLNVAKMLETASKFL
jgi:hypothetical protein